MGVEPAGLVRGAGGWDPQTHSPCLARSAPPEPTQLPGAQPAESKQPARDLISHPPREQDPQRAPGSAIPITEAGLRLHPWGLGFRSPQPSPVRGHSSVQRHTPPPPPRRCINTGNIEAFCSKYLFLGKTPGALCCVLFCKHCAKRFGFVFAETQRWRENV